MLVSIGLVCLVYSVELPNDSRGAGNNETVRLDSVQLDVRSASDVNIGGAGTRNGDKTAQVSLLFSRQLREFDCAVRVCFDHKVRRVR